MTDKGVRQIAYLLESHQAWKPDQLVINPWDIGLTPHSVTKRIVIQTTLKIYDATATKL